MTSDIKKNYVTSDIKTDDKLILMQSYTSYITVACFIIFFIPLVIGGMEINEITCGASDTLTKYGTACVYCT